MTRKRSRKHRLKRDANGRLFVDQGCVHGFPITFNPDDGRFYIHALGVGNGTDVIATFKDWRNAVQYARRRSLANHKEEE